MTHTDTGLSEQILETAKNLFVNKGYHGLSMREISDELGVSKAALYYYFRDKEELFLAILNTYLDELSAALDRILVEPSSSEEKVRLFAEYVLTQPARQRATIRLATQEIAQLSMETRKAFDVIYREKFVGKVQSIIKSGIEKGEFRVMQPEVAVWALLGIMFPYFYPGKSGELPVPQETIQEVLNIYFGGICL